MKILQIVLLTAGLIISGNILGRVAAQNDSNANRAASSNQNTSNVNAGRRQTANTVPDTPAAETDVFEIKYGDEPKLLKVISMQKIVKFNRNGRVQVQLIEEEGQSFIVRFVRDDETIARFVMKSPSGGYIREDFNSAVDPKISFRIIRMDGIEGPLVHVVIVQPGGTDYGFWSAIFGEINGRIRLLSPPTTRFSWEGGIQIGDLGPGNGAGLAVWNSVWDDGESHYGEHIYVVDIYHFNKTAGKFVKTKQLRTKKKADSPAAALALLGLSFYRDAVRDFPEFLEYRENF